MTQCTPENAEDVCGVGARCSSFGMCVSAPDAAIPDSGMPDAPPPTPDAGLSCVVVGGGTDADGDGFCAGVATDLDCDDDDDSVSPMVAEVCTPSIDGSVPRDENCDGFIDEGCGWFFGRPHVVPEWVMPSASGYVGTHGMWMSSDGLRAYMSYSRASASSPGLFMAERSSRGEPFGAPQALVAGAWAGYEFTMSADELSGVLMTTEYELVLISRTSASTPFVRGASLGGGVHPTLSRDGLEVIFHRGGVLVHVLRATTSDAFGPAVPLEGIGGVSPIGANLSPDGLGLFYYTPEAGRNILWRARRDALHAPTFEDAAPVASLTPTGSENYVLPVFAESTRELYFLSCNDPFGPHACTHVRVPVCRDGPCVEPSIPCPTGGRRSPDLLHCYEQILPTSNYDTARSACLDPETGRHVVEVESSGEQELVWGAFSGGANLWLALEETTTTDVFEWASNAPLNYVNWGAADPTPGPGEECAVLYQPSGYDGRRGDFNCAASARAVCETEMWPTW